MNELQVFSNEQFGKIRTIAKNGEPWFVGKDIASALGYANLKNAVAMHVDTEDKTSALIQGPGSNYKSKAIIVNESGLYALVFGSKLEKPQSSRRGRDCTVTEEQKRKKYDVLVRLFKVCQFTSEEIKNYHCRETGDSGRPCRVGR